ncbi:MAG TPA: zinc ribbon domain-containing protein [Candidatus Thermoplasmatota archaeon]|nr:zinc ribbon domain-containing protein [Candidatus Thermoplasmatota archaeon]
MADARRALLWTWALVSLVLTAYTGIVLFYSDPAPGNLQEMSHGDGSAFTSWTRVVTIPVGADGPLSLQTSPRGDDLRTLEETGDVVVARPDGSPGPLIARVVAFVRPNATTNGTFDVPALNLTNVTSFVVPNVGLPDPATGQWTRGNLTVNLTGMAAQEGYILKADGAGEPMVFNGNATRLTAPVPEAAITGKVLFFLDGWTQLLKVSLSTVSTAIPIVLLILTQKPKPAPPGFDVQTPITGVRCVECGRTMPKEATFCFGCGAYKRS